MLFYPFLGNGSPTKMDGKKSVPLYILILSSLMEDLAKDLSSKRFWVSEMGPGVFQSGWD